MDIKEFANIIKEEDDTSIFDENNLSEMATKGPAAEKEYESYKKFGGKKSFENFLKTVVFIAANNKNIKNVKQLVNYEKMKPGMKRAEFSQKKFNKDIEGM